MNGYDSSAQGSLYEPQEYNDSMISNQGYGDALYHGESLFKDSHYGASSNKVYGDAYYADGIPAYKQRQSLYKDTHYDETSDQGYGDARYGSGFPSHDHGESLYGDTHNDALGKDLTSQYDEASLLHNSNILSSDKNFHTIHICLVVQDNSIGDLVSD